MNNRQYEDVRVLIDYETRSRADLKITGAIEYAKCRSTSIFCVGYRIIDGNNIGPVQIWIPERSSMPSDLWRGFKHGTLVAHNASFERAITRYVLPRYELVTREQRRYLAGLPASRWRCTAAKAAACSLPRKLETVAQVLGLKTQKDQRGHKLILKYCKPRKPSKHNPKHWWDDKKDLQDIYSYCKTDVQAEYELDEALPDLTAAEQKVWELDQAINDRGILIDIPTVKTILELIKEETDNITRKVQSLSDGTIAKATQRQQVLNWVNKHGGEMENLQAATIRDKLLDRNCPPLVRQMLEYRQAASKTSTAKYRKMIQVVGADHRARELLLYCGADRTGRWSGKRLQPHNFPRPTLKDFNSDEAIGIIKSEGIKGVRKKYGKDRVMEVLVSVIRGMLIASPGKKLYCADFAAVELCLSFWVAEHAEGIAAIREGRKMYEEMAAATFSMDLEWLLTEEGKASIERFVGKESVLGCNYGLGWAKFLKNCHLKGVPQVTAEMAKKAVYTFRRVHWPVPEAWKNLERATVAAIKNPGKTYKLNKVAIYVKDEFLCIKLPSGRRLRYFKPRVSHKQLASGRMVPQIHHWGMELHQWCEVVMWGGQIFNNIVQGIARDFMMNAAQNIENAGYQFILSVHDEGVAEREIGCGNLKEYLHLMAGKLPAWASGAPITATGFVSRRYRK